MMTKDAPSRDRDRTAWVKPIEGFNKASLQDRFERYLEDLTRPLDEVAAVKLLGRF